jgi:hypothetical protein
MPPQDSGVRFNEGDDYGAPPQRSEGFDLTGKLVSWGLVSSREQAQYVLIAVAVIAVLVAGYFFMGSISGGSVPPPPPVSS